MLYLVAIQGVLRAAETKGCHIRVYEHYELKMSLKAARRHGAHRSKAHVTGASVQRVGAPVSSVTVHAYGDAASCVSIEVPHQR